MRFSDKFTSMYHFVILIKDSLPRRSLILFAIDCVLSTYLYGISLNIHTEPICSFTLVMRKVKDLLGLSKLVSLFQEGMKVVTEIRLLERFLSLIIFLGCASFVAYRQRLSKIYISQTFVLRKAGGCYGGYRGLRNN